MSALRAATSISLDGNGWTFRTTLDERAHAVSIPNSWPVMQGYRNYIGGAIYEDDFDTPSIHPGQVVRLHFNGVYYKAHVWLNGHMLGMHEGGYTPFEFDVTRLLLPRRNHLLVEVNNTPTLSSIPGLATAGHGEPNPPFYGSAAGEGIVGWMPYGGITRPVSLLITNAVYIRRMKIDAEPDLKSGQASITVHAFLHNGGDKDAAAEIEGSVATLPVQFKPTRIAAGGDAELTWTGTLPKAHLWSVRDPFLYDAVLSLPGDTTTAKIGVRQIRVQGTELLLNGKPIHLYGANRVSEDPDEGLRESAAIIHRDLSDMLADNMRMMRIAHYPQAPALLDFADAHGMLIIAEAGNWNFSAWQMADPGIRALWQSQMREMMEQDWNHPSVIAWSMGNEYESASPQGIDWTRDMRAFTLQLDFTRLITFASRFTGYPWVHAGKDEASQFSDFVSVNIYGDYARRLDRVHQLWPDKPVFVTEFGKMGEDEPQDPERIADITAAVTAMKARPWVIGGSLWTWADYRSLHRGTPSDEIRKWGVVDFYRGHRDSWEAVRKLFDTELP
ncbi:MAG: glycoside hydrolase family 2 protein [Acidobacteriaceae bacterium]